MTRGAEADRAFIRANTVLAAPPLCPEIRLHLATEITPIWQATEAFLDRHNLPPPYWAFAWVGGQALARHTLDRPELVAGRRVLDFAAGSGLGAIAAARGGAGHAEASDLDPMAAAAIGLNADANGVELVVHAEDLTQSPRGEWDLVLAGDVCYDREMTERCMPWLRGLAARGVAVLLADPGRAYLPRDGLVRLAAYTIPCNREIEGHDSRETLVYRVGG